MKYLHFTTHANPNKNTIKQGLLLSNKFMESARWILLHSNKKYSDASDNDFHFNGFKVWRDVRCGLLVLESYSSNRNGIVNSISFKDGQIQQAKTKIRHRFSWIGLILDALLL